MKKYIFVFLIGLLIVSPLLVWATETLVDQGAPGPKAWPVSQVNGGGGGGTSGVTNVSGTNLGVTIAGTPVIQPVGGAANSANPPIVLVATAIPTNTPSIATFVLKSLTPVVIVPTVTGKQVYVEGVEAFGTSSNAYSNLSFTTQLTPIEGPVGMNAGASALLLDPSSNVIRFIGNSSGDLSVTESAAATFNGRVFYWQQ